MLGTKGSTVFKADSIGTLAGIVAILAGIYLLTSQAAGPNSYLELLAHGIGAYFVGKGLWMIAMAHMESDSRSSLDDLVAFAAAQHDRETASDELIAA